MKMMSKAPGWAVERADQLASAVCQELGDIVTNTTTWRVAFARYIASKEEPPVDPLLIEARKIAASQWEDRTATRFIAGDYDETDGVKAILAALRRGMELAKEQGQ
jgi:hypothetical protein